MADQNTDDRRMGDGHAPALPDGPADHEGAERRQASDKHDDAERSDAKNAE